MKTAEITLAEIETATKEFASRRYQLANLVSALQQEVADVTAEFLPQIKKLVASTAERQSFLQQLIQENPGLFEKPRTQIFHEVKVGFRKGTGGIDWDDDDKVIKLIREHFTKSQADLLIKTTEKPIAKAIEDLEVADLKKIGCRVEDTGDVIVIKPIDSAVEKAVKALLKDATETEEAA
jgi:Bacteriophage Mu Gam like protein